MISQGLDGWAKVWDLTTGRQLLDMSASAEAKFSPDGRLIATAAANHFVKLWDALTSRGKVLSVGCWIGIGRP